MRIVILFIVTSHCEMGTRKQSTDFWGGGRELVTLKNIKEQKRHQNNFWLINIYNRRWSCNNDFKILKICTPSQTTNIWYSLKCKVSKIFNFYEIILLKKLLETWSTKANKKTSKRKERDTENWEVQHRSQMREHQERIKGDPRKTGVN